MVAGSTPAEGITKQETSSTVSCFAGNQTVITADLTLADIVAQEHNIENH